MRKLSEVEELAAIKEIESGKSGREVAKKYGLSNVEMQYKFNLYQKHGQIKLSNYAYSWTIDQKKEVLEYMRRNHLSYKQTGIQFGIKGSSTIRKWAQKYMENSMDGVEDKKESKRTRVAKPKPPKTREEELLDRILYLEAENAYLKKLNALVAEREKKERENK